MTLIYILVSSNKFKKITGAAYYNDILNIRKWTLKYTMLRN